MINLDERYQSYIGNPAKGLTIDGIKEQVTGYGYHCDNGEIKGHYVTTTNYKLYYNMNEQFIRMEAHRIAN